VWFVEMAQKENSGATWMKNDPAPPSLIVKNNKFKALCKILSRKINFHIIFIKLFVVKN
jgi:hypothetical protein